MQDTEDQNKRLQNELNKLHQECETARAEYQNAVRELNVICKIIFN